MVAQTGKTTISTDYLGGYQYKNAVLQFFPTAEGYVEPLGSSYKYVYQYKDHLGNVRLSYDKSLTVQEENNYYPFGLKHQGYGAPIVSTNEALRYRFQGQERQDELGLNWDSFKWRNYDYAIGRFMSIDPLTEDYMDWGPYVFSGNRVIDSRELEGLEPVSVKAQWNGAFKEMGQTFAGAFDKIGIEIKSLFTVSTEIAPLTTYNKTTEFTEGTNFLNYVNAKQFDQSTKVSPITTKVETKVEVKAEVKGSAKAGVLDVATKNTTTKNVNSGKTTNETKVVVGKEGNGVFASNKTNLKTGENTTRVGVQVEAKTPAVNSTTIKVGASFSVGQKEKP
ncbi:RHS repeat domain-containing protein [Flavobacterium branchiophilum]|uniref:RHS repeat domain-containing protein n=1 Tax=Flavobacterium branchiophilum TaxID=55197 RepID=UPI0039EFCF3D